MASNHASYLDPPVVGVGYRESTLRHAEASGSIDTWTLDLAEGVRDADCAVVCTPVGLVAEQAVAAARAMKLGSVVTDVASTKAAITRRVEAEAPAGVAFVPAHPMAGSEKRGNTSARDDLFEGARVILTPTARTSAEAVRCVEALWRGVGARVERLAPAQHDAIVAQISHLPHLIAPALINAIEEGCLPYAATGLRDTTRIAASDSRLWLDIFRDNRENVLAAAAGFVRQLDNICAALERGDYDELAGLLDRARTRRQWLDGDGSAPPLGHDDPSTRSREGEE
jgi:prephenate dehydrogenase